MATLNPYLALKGTCREAMGFYKEIFGGELSIMTFADTPMKDQMPAEMQDQIVHAMLKISDSFKIMATDMSGPETDGGIVTGNNVQLTLVCESAEEIERLFNHLSTDGKVKEALNKGFWGGTFGSLTDKYGIHWMFEYSAEQPQA